MFSNRIIKIKQYYIKLMNIESKSNMRNALNWIINNSNNNINNNRIIPKMLNNKITCGYKNLYS